MFVLKTGPDIIYLRVSLAVVEQTYRQRKELEERLLALAVLNNQKQGEQEVQWQAQGEPQPEQKEMEASQCICSSSFRWMRTLYRKGCMATLSPRTKNNKWP
jgi:hypothetical protein